MKTAFSRSILTILVALTLLISTTTVLAQRAARVQAVASSQQAGPVLPACAYSDLLNGLSAGGR